jgi:hypothetical protein
MGVPRGTFANRCDQTVEGVTNGGNTTEEAKVGQGAWRAYEKGC